MEELRCGTRVPTTWTLESGGWLLGYTCNVSACGILFLALREQTVGAKMDVELIVNAQQRIRCTIRLVREQPTSAPRCRIYGAEFVHFAGQDKHLLTDVLRKLLEQRAVAEKLPIGVK